MELVCLGLNHKTASIEVRERFAVGPSKLGEASNELLKQTGADEGLVISTSCTGCSSLSPFSDPIMNLPGWMRTIRIPAAIAVPATLLPAGTVGAGAGRRLMIPRSSSCT